MEFDFTKEPGKILLERGLNKSGSPLVSIITPYYNAGKYFEQTFNCVMNQTFPWFEWIVVDDGSTNEEDVRILSQIQMRDSRIFVYRKENGGIASARNLGIQKASAEIVIPLDADDLIVPEFIEELYLALYFHPEAGWSYTDSVGFGEEEYLWNKPFSSERMKRENLLVCTAAIRKNCLVQAGFYDESVKHFHEDWYLWLRLLAQGRYPVHIKGFHFWYRRGKNGVLQTVKKEKELRTVSQEKVRQAAAQVLGEVEAVEYPLYGVPGGYNQPRSSNWDRRIYQDHKKIHVLLLLPWLEMGGADLFNLDICRMIDKGRFEIGIITTVASENSWRQRFEEYVTDIFALPDFLSPENYPEFISYYIKSREVDVLFLSNSYYGYYLLPWLRKEFPDLAIIDYVHMEEWYWRNGGYARTSGAMGEILEKTYVCNEHTREVMIRDFGRKPESIETLYIGVDEGVYAADAVEAGIVRAELGIGQERPIVLFPCRVHPQKRPFLMVEIAKALRQEVPEIAFVVVGDGPQLEELRITLKREGLEGTVYLAGRQSDMRPYYKDCTLTLICSLKEGLALTAYESLSMGRPVVTSNVGGQAELVDHSVGRVLPLAQDESNDLDCRSFPEEEISQYVHAITEILSDRNAYKRMSSACRKRIETGFSSRMAIRKLEEIFVQRARSEILHQERKQFATVLKQVSGLISELPTLSGEIESYEAMYKNSFVSDTKNELVRIANSKWGSRLIKIAFKMKLNRLFR